MTTGPTTGDRFELDAAGLTDAHLGYLDRRHPGRCDEADGFARLLCDLTAGIAGAWGADDAVVTVAADWPVTLEVGARHRALGRPPPRRRDLLVPNPRGPDLTTNHEATDHDATPDDARPMIKAPLTLSPGCEVVVVEPAIGPWKGRAIASLCDQPGEVDAAVADMRARGRAGRRAIGKSIAAAIRAVVGSGRRRAEPQPRQPPGFLGRPPHLGGAAGSDGDKDLAAAPSLAAAALADGRARKARSRWLSFLRPVACARGRADATP